jgi:hypothetical protein
VAEVPPPMAAYLARPRMSTYLNLNLDSTLSDLVSVRTSVTLWTPIQLRVTRGGLPPAWPQIQVGLLPALPLPLRLSLAGWHDVVDLRGSTHASSTGERVVTARRRMAQGLDCCTGNCQGPHLLCTHCKSTLWWRPPQHRPRPGFVGRFTRKRALTGLFMHHKRGTQQHTCSASSRATRRRRSGALHHQSRHR